MPRKKSDKFDDRIISLDLEVSSVYLIDGKWQSFNYDLNNDDYSKIQKQSIMYLWGIAIEDEFYHGRDYTSLRYKLKEISDSREGKQIIYIHNLGYEFQFLLNVIEDFEPFARKPHSPIYAYSPSLDIEFRCTLFMTNTKLENVAKDYHLNIQKLVGSLDFSKVRHEETPIFKDEIDYLKNDCFIIVAYIRMMKDEYMHQCYIPYTQTGQVREVMKNKLNWRLKMKIGSMNETDFEMFKFLVKMFMGGLTHANLLNVNMIHDDVMSDDIVSDYPSCFAHFKYPSEPFKKAEYDGNKRYAWALKVKITRAVSKISFTYLSESKAINLLDGSSDNGRLIQFESAEFYITDVDLEIIKMCYHFEDLEIIESYKSFKKYIPNAWLKIMLEFYHKKNTLKGVAGREREYMLSKQMLNSMYGMCVTNDIRDNVTFDTSTNLWDVEELTDISEIEEMLLKKTEPLKAITNYAWGVWCTAYARKKLMDIIVQLDDDVIYCDTDSVKYINDHSDVFEKYNKQIRKLNHDTADRLGIDVKELRNLGEYENDGKYSKFITLGAKKYAYEDKDGKLGIVVSGLSKKAVNHIKSIEDFHDDKLFNYDVAGKTQSFYLNNQRVIEVEDYLGNKKIINQRYGINLKPNTYHLSIAVSFQEMINFANQRKSTRLSLFDKTFNKLLFKKKGGD